MKIEKFQLTGILAKTRAYMFTQNCHITTDFLTKSICLCNSFNGNFTEVHCPFCSYWALY